MTIKQFLGILFIITVLGYYENNKERNIDTVVIPDIETKIVPVKIPEKPKKELIFHNVSKYREIKDNKTYSDVLSHSMQKPYEDQYSRRINVHETSHGITSDLRKFYTNQLNTKLNVFYVLDSKCIVLEESNISMKLVTKYIPKTLRSHRYNLYFVKGIVDWNDMPSYIIDEWNSYILSSKNSVEDFHDGLLKERVDAVSGCLDFSIYSVCFAMAVKENDKKYWENYPKFKNTIRFLLERAEKTYNEGNSIENFRNTSQNNLYNNLQNHPDAQQIRNFLIKEFDGLFLQKDQTK